MLTSFLIKIYQPLPPLCCRAIMLSLTRRVCSSRLVAGSVRALSSTPAVNTATETHTGQDYSADDPRSSFFFLHTLGGYCKWSGGPLFGIWVPQGVIKDYLQWHFKQLKLEINLCTRTKTWNLQITTCIKLIWIFSLQKCPLWSDWTEETSESEMGHRFDWQNAHYQSQV